MAGLYTASFAPSAQSGAVDFFELTSPSTGFCLLHAIDIAQTTELGDAAEEWLDWAIKRGNSGTTSGSVGGTLIGPSKVSGTSQASALITAPEVLNTTKMTGGTITTVHRSAFNVRAGLLWIPTPEMRIGWGGGERLTVELVSAPADSITWVGSVYWEELG